MSRHPLDFRWKPPDGAHSPATASWKDRYRQRCKEKLKESRFQHLLARRISDGVGASGDSASQEKTEARDKAMTDIQVMMSSEWEEIQREKAAEVGINPMDIPAPSIDDKIALMEELLEELKQEKLLFQGAHAALYEEFAQKEDEELCQAFNRLSACEVFCPMCQKNNLQESRGLISCQCGLEIDTEQDSLTLSDLSRNLRQGAEEHSANCDLAPCFSKKEYFGVSTLVMSCEPCDFCYIIV